MKNKLLQCILSLVFCFTTAESFSIVGTTIPVQKEQQTELGKANSTISLDQQNLEQQLGRKLKLKERIALKVLQKKTQRQAKNTVDTGEVQMDAFALTSFICGVVGLFLFGYILGVVAIVFGAISLSRIKKDPEYKKGKGLAIAGLILGIIGIILVTVLLAAIFAG